MSILASPAKPASAAEEAVSVINAESPKIRRAVATLKPLRTELYSEMPNAAALEESLSSVLADPQPKRPELSKALGDLLASLKRVNAAAAVVADEVDRTEADIQRIAQKLRQEVRERVGRSIAGFFSPDLLPRAVNLSRAVISLEDKLGHFNLDTSGQRATAIRRVVPLRLSTDADPAPGIVAVFDAVRRERDAIRVIAETFR